MPCAWAPSRSSTQQADSRYNEADETGRGFTFQSYNADDFLAAIDRALALYYNEPEKWLRLAENDMAVDSSWDVPAQKYMALFQNVCGQ